MAVFICSRIILVALALVYIQRQIGSCTRSAYINQVQHLRIGEIVDIWTFSDWSVVANATTMAAALSDNEFSWSSVPKTPGGGPAIDFEPQCSIILYDEHGDPFYGTLLQVVATLGQETVTIGFGQTAAVGAFQVTNGFGFHVLSNSAVDGHSEPSPRA